MIYSRTYDDHVSGRSTQLVAIKLAIQRAMHLAAPRSGGKFSEVGRQPIQYIVSPLVTTDGLRHGRQRLASHLQVNRRAADQIAPPAFLFGHADNNVKGLLALDVLDRERVRLPTLASPISEQQQRVAGKHVQRRTQKQPKQGIDEIVVNTASNRSSISVAPGSSIFTFSSRSFSLARYKRLLMVSLLVKKASAIS
jgi:hypothetical protein